MPKRKWEFWDQRNTANAPDADELKIKENLEGGVEIQM